jgi:hypothetical protein
MVISKISVEKDTGTMHRGKAIHRAVSVFPGRRIRGNFDSN